MLNVDILVNVHRVVNNFTLYRGSAVAARMPWTARKEREVVIQLTSPSHPPPPPPPPPPPSHKEGVSNGETTLQDPPEQTRVFYDPTLVVKEDYNKSYFFVVVVAVGTSLKLSRRERENLLYASPFHFLCEPCQLGGKKKKRRETRPPLSRISLFYGRILDN